MLKPSQTTCAGFLALFSYVLVSLSYFPMTLFVSIDGACFLSCFEQIRVYGDFPLDLSVISGLAGMGEMVSPAGVWIHPALLPFSWQLKVVNPAVACYLIVIVVAALSVYWLGRVLKLPAEWSMLGAQIQAVVFFPPILTLYLDPLSPALAIPLAGHASLPVSLCVIFLVLLLQTGASSLLVSITTVIAMAGTVLYSVLCDPLWTAVIFIASAPLVVGILLGSMSRQELAWRCFGLALCLIVLLGCNVHQFYRAVSNNVARQMFPDEIVGEVQTFDQFAGVAFQTGTGGVLMMILAASLLAVTVWGSKQQRGFALGVLLLCGSIFILGLIYIYGGINWNKPPPAYFEHTALPAYLVGCLLGVRISCGKLHTTTRGARFKRWCDSRFQKDYRHLRVAVVLVIPLAAAVVLFGFTERPATETYTSSSGGSVFRHLVQRASQQPGETFRGSVAIITDDDDVVGRARLVHPVALWNLQIPTLDDYNELTTPQSYYFFSRTLAGLDDPRQDTFLQQKNTLMITQIRPRILAALGARYVMTYADVSAPRLQLICSDSNEFGATLNLYEIEDPNLGNYSPVNVIVAREARDVVERIVKEDFSFQEDVVLFDDLRALDLVPARSASMSFERGAVRLRASSAGISLLVLPVQFSHALTVTTCSGSHDASMPRLMRANLIQTGILFEHEMEIMITHEFGLFQGVWGRLRDVQDCRRYSIEQDGSIEVPTGYQPHAIDW